MTAITSLPKHLQDVLAAEREVIRLAEKVRATGGAESVCVEYDAAQKAETEAYERMNAIGLSKASWKAYDSVRRDMYRASNV